MCSPIVLYEVPESKTSSIPDEFRLSSIDRDAGCAVSVDGTVTQVCGLGHDILMDVMFT